MITKKETIDFFNVFRGEIGMSRILTEEDLQEIQSLKASLPSAKKKVIDSIKTSKNKLHLDFCEEFIKQFKKKYEKVLTEDTFDIEECLLIKKDQLCIYI